MHYDLEWRISDNMETKIDTNAHLKPVSKWTTMTPRDDNGDHTAVEEHTSTTGSAGIKFDCKVVKMKKKTCSITKSKEVRITA
jgi:hypothetical protein